MPLNPLPWPIAAKVAAVTVLAACAGGGAALVVNSGQALPLSPYAACVQRVRATQNGSSDLSYCASLAGAPAASAPTPAANSAPTATPAAEPGMTTFICSGTTNATLLQWQDSNGYLSGSYEYSSISGQAPQEQVTSDQGGLSGTLNGNAISLSIGLQQPLYGTLDGSQLTLNVPQSDGSFQAGTCNSGLLSDWNSTVQALDSQVSGDNNTALQQQAQASSAAAVSSAQQSLSNDVSTLQSDSSSLNSNTQLASDINQMKTDYQTEQNEYQTEVTQGSCSDGSLGSDAATVSSDSATVDSDQASEQSDVTSIQDSLSGIQTDISNVNNDLTTLQNLGETPGIDASGVLAAGQKAISNANAAIQWANQQANAIDGQAHQLATTAQNYESSKGC